MSATGTEYSFAEYGSCRPQQFGTECQATSPLQTDTERELSRSNRRQTLTYEFLCRSNLDGKIKVRSLQKLFRTPLKVVLLPANKPSSTGIRMSNHRPTAKVANTAWHATIIGLR